MNAHVKRAEILTAFVIRHAQLSARKCIIEYACCIAHAQGTRMRFLPAPKKETQ